MEKRRSLKEAMTGLCVNILFLNAGASKFIDEENPIREYTTWVDIHYENKGRVAFIEPGNNYDVIINSHGEGGVTIIDSKTGKAIMEELKEGGFRPVYDGATSKIHMKGRDGSKIDTVKQVYGILSKYIKPEELSMSVIGCTVPVNVLETVDLPKELENCISYIEVDDNFLDFKK